MGHPVRLLGRKHAGLQDLMLAVVFGALEVLRNAGIGGLKEPVEDDSASALGDW